MVVGRINGVVALTGCFHKKMYERFDGPKKSGRNNEVVVRRGSTVQTKVNLQIFTEISRFQDFQCLKVERTQTCPDYDLTYNLCTSQFHPRASPSGKPRAFDTR